MEFRWLCMKVQNVLTAISNKMWTLLKGWYTSSNYILVAGNCKLLHVFILFLTMKINYDDSKDHSLEIHTEANKLH